MANTREDIKSAVGPGLSLQASSNSPALTSQPDKKTISATILFTDIVDSTGLAANLGNRRWSEIVAGYYEVVHREVNANSGKVIHGAGDGFLVVFDAPTRAIVRAQSEMTFVIWRLRVVQDFTAVNSKI
jgi:class 3 adenylate cyclase